MRNSIPRRILASAKLLAANDLQEGAPSRDGDAGLRELVHRARTAASVPDLVGIVMDCARGVTRSTVAGFFLQTPTGPEIHQIGASDALATRYAAFTASAIDPIHAALARNHGIVRSSDLFDDADWRRQAFHHELEARFGLEAYMAGEIIDARAPRGVIGVARRSGAAAFSPLDAQRLQTMCMHVSVALTRLALCDRRPLADAGLSPRQQQLVQLVGKGLTNEQIAAECGVTLHAVKKSLERLFGKFHVASRAELIATLGVRADTR